jgi:hypothetical protein
VLCRWLPVAQAPPDDEREQDHNPHHYQPKRLEHRPHGRNMAFRSLPAPPTR